MNPVPHAAAPAAVMSVQGRKQKLPLAAMEQAVYPTQREFGQSPSTLHCFSHTRSVALYPMHVSPAAHSVLAVQALPWATVPDGKQAY